MENELLSGAPTISVLVSVGEDADDLMDLHEELAAELEKLRLEYELLFLIGSAPPRALEQALGLQRLHANTVRVLQFAPTVGRAGMLDAGVRRSRGSILFTLPGRFEVELGVLGALLEAVRGDTDFAFASRTRGRVGVAARVQSELFNKLVSLAAGTRYRDIASETRALRRQVAEETPLYGDFYRYLPMLADRLGFRVREIPATQHPRARARAVHALRIYVWRAVDILSIFFIGRFTRHPLRLFGGVGSVFGAVGSAILLLVAIQRLTGTPASDRPVLVLGTLLLGLGVQVFTIGLLGELILFFHARSIRDYRIAAIYEGSRVLRAEREDGEG